MRDFLQRRWFLLALLLLIITGHQLGVHAPASVDGVIKPLFNNQSKAWLVAVILFCMSITLDGRRFRHAIMRPLPVLWAIAVNAIAIPLAVSLLLPLQLSPDFAAGLLIAASVPCTLAAASVWTRRAGGNDAVSLLVTLLTNGACVVYTPIWLQLFADSAALLDLQDMMRQLFLTALLPTLLGQLARLIPACASAADWLKIPLGVAAQCGVLIIVFVSACDGGSRMSADGAATASGAAAPSAAALGVVAGSCVALHLGAMGLALFGARLLRLERPDAIAIAFAASQKTLPIGVLIATDPGSFGATYPWAVFPMLIYHTLQLFIDTAIADRMRSRGAAPAAPDGGDGGTSDAAS
jgi:sodium/bile acid cotransporter 7